MTGSRFRERDKEMLQLRKQGVPLAEVAKQFGLSISRVSHITWDEERMADEASERPSGKLIGATSKYPWMKLEIGERFIVACEPGRGSYEQGRLSSCKANAQRRSGRKFTTKIIPRGIRVTRVA